MLGRTTLENKLDAVLRVTDASGYDFETNGYVAINFIYPVNPLLLTVTQADTISLSGLQSMIEAHNKKEIERIKRGG